MKEGKKMKKMNLEDLKNEWEIEVEFDEKNKVLNIYDGEWHHFDYDMISSHKVLGNFKNYTQALGDLILCEWNFEVEEFEKKFGDDLEN